MFGYVDINTIAKRLGYHPQYVQKLAFAGKIPAIKRGRAWFFDEEKVKEFYEQKSVQKLLG